jgi:hypothetical protein
MGGTCRKYDRDETCVQNLVGKPECKRQFEILGLDEDNIEMDLKEIGWDSCGSE